MGLVNRPLEKQDRCLIDSVSTVYLSCGALWSEQCHLGKSSQVNAADVNAQNVTFLLQDNLIVCTTRPAGMHLPPLHCRVHAQLDWFSIQNSAAAL